MYARSLYPPLNLSGTRGLLTVNGLSVQKVLWRNWEENIAHIVFPGGNLSKLIN